MSLHTGGLAALVWEGLFTVSLSNASGEVEAQDEDVHEDAEAVDDVRVGIGMSIGSGEHDDDDGEGAGDDAGDAVVIVAVCRKICAVPDPVAGNTRAISPLGRRVGTNCSPAPFGPVVKKIPFEDDDTAVGVWWVSTVGVAVDVG
jgi:hypothetical protein